MKQEQRQKIMDSTEYAHSLLLRSDTVQDSKLYEACLESLAQYGNPTLVPMLRMYFKRGAIKPPYPRAALELIERCIQYPDFALNAVGKKYLDSEPRMFSKAIVSLAGDPFKSGMLFSIRPELIRSKHFGYLCKSIANSADASLTFLRRAQYEELPHSRGTDMIVMKACRSPMMAFTVMNLSVCKTYKPWWLYAADMAMSDCHLAMYAILDKKISYEMDARIYEKAIVAAAEYNPSNCFELIETENDTLSQHPELYRRVLKIADQHGIKMPPTVLRDCFYQEAIPPDSQNYRRRVKEMFEN